MTQNSIAQGKRSIRYFLASILVLLTCAAAPGGAQTSDATKSLNKCHAAMAKEGAAYSKGLLKALDGCMNKISKQVVASGGEKTVGDALPTCVTQLRKVKDSRGLGKSLPEKFQTKVVEVCDPTQNEHTLEDILGPGASVPEPLLVEKLATWCINFGGSGEIDDVDDWLACIKTAHECEVRQALSVRHPRVLEWLKALEAEIVLEMPEARDPQAFADAQSAVVELLGSLDSDQNDELDPGCAGFEGVTCLAGEFRNPGSLVCEDCPAGSFSSTGDGACIPCPEGRFAATTGSIACEPCPVGSSQALAGQSSCQQCDPGQFAPTTGAVFCLLCEPGTFSATPGASTCLDCPPGHFQGDAGASSCDPCLAGQFQDESGAAACKPCPLGTIASVDGASTCDKCAVGKFASSEGQSICQDCPPGSYGPTQGSAQCLSCEVGTAQALTGQTACVDCPLGSVQTSPGQTSCSPCPAGTFANLPSESCMPCPVGGVCDGGNVLVTIGTQAGYWRPAPPE